MIGSSAVPPAELNLQRARDLALKMRDAGIQLSEECAEEYESALTGERGKALIVILPRSTTQVSFALSTCHAMGVPVVAQGANTGLAGAGVPDRTGRQAILSLRRMTQIEKVSTENRTARVQAGVRLSALQARLDAEGLMFPVDIGADATIGGVVATNAGGTRVVRYGDVRTNVLGVEAVLADGTVVDGLCDVRKNNVGLDVKQLFIGTSGSLGVVTRVDLNLHRRANDSVVVLIPFAKFAGAVNLLSWLECRAPEILLSFEGMSRAALQRVRKVPANLFAALGGSWPVYCVCLEMGAVGNEQSIRTRMEAILEEAAALDLISDAIFEQDGEIRALRAALPQAVSASSQPLLTFDVSVPRESLIPFRTALERLMQEARGSCGWCDFGHLADGGLHIAVFLSSPVHRMAVPASLRIALYDLVVREHHGSFSSEHGIGPGSRAFQLRYQPPGVRDLCSQVQRICDPQSLLGRVSLGPMLDEESGAARAVMSSREPS